MQIKFKTENAAFGVDEEDADARHLIKISESKRILEKIIFDIFSGKNEGSIIDINGNKIGQWKL